MAKVTSKIKDSDGTSHYIASTAYCICSTAASTAAKVANVIGDQADDASSADFYLVKGTTIHVKFTYANTAASPTLAVGGTTAKSIVGSSWGAGAVVEFTYDGTNWVQNSGKVEEVKVLKVSSSSVSAFPHTINNSKITASHEVLKADFSNSSAILSAVNWTTSAGSIQLTGTISGTTNITLWLVIPAT